MKELKTLIDNASKICGGDAALARKLGISKALLSMMKAGERAITPGTAAELAEITGEDARQAAIDAVIESAKGTRRESVLREILGKARAAGVAETLGISYKIGLSSATEKAASSAQSINDSIHRIYQEARRLLSRRKPTARILHCV